MDIEFEPAQPDPVAHGDQVEMGLRAHARALGAYMTELIAGGFERFEAFELVQARQCFDLYGPPEDE